MKYENFEKAKNLYDIITRLKEDINNINRSIKQSGNYRAYFVVELVGTRDGGEKIKIPLEGEKLEYVVNKSIKDIKDKIEKYEKELEQL